METVLLIGAGVLLGWMATPKRFGLQLIALLVCLLCLAYSAFAGRWGWALANALCGLLWCRWLRQSEVTADRTRLED